MDGGASSSPASQLIPPPKSGAPPLYLTVRFSNSHPDLQLEIANPTRTTIAALRHKIRICLAAEPPSPSAADPATGNAPLARARLRFIHGGKILQDRALLDDVLIPIAPPPGKGKYVEKGKGEEGAVRVYVNCSIGGEMTEEEVEKESVAALEGEGENSAAPRTPEVQHRRSTPRGFDRLLQAGFTAVEVNQLRLQFREIQASRHTPDTMPSPERMRGMEDAWIDGNHGGNGPEGREEDEEGLTGLLDVMVKAIVVGFLFPLGSAGWLVREEGMLSRRWRVCAVFGVVFSVLFGAVRNLGEE